MRIGVSGYVGNRITGIGRVLQEVIKKLAVKFPSDYYVLFVNYDMIDEFHELAVIDNVDVCEISVSKDNPLLNVIWHQFRFQKLLKENQCDLALIPNFSLLLWKAVPTVVVIHDMIEFVLSKKFSKIRTLYRYLVVPRMARKSNAIITVSESSKNDIVEYCRVSSEKITVAPNAVNHQIFRFYSEEEVNSVKMKYSLPENYVLYVGIIDYPGKNVMGVLEAFFRVKESRNTNDKIVIVGKNGFNSEIVHSFVNRSKFQEDVIFTGYVSDFDLPKIFVGAKVFLYLSYYEGFGLPVLEAMACGVPVICSKTSSFPEIVGNMDVLVDPYDIDSISMKLEELLASFEKRKDLAMQGIQIASTYSWNTTALLYRKVFCLVNKINER